MAVNQSGDGLFILYCSKIQPYIHFFIFSAGVIRGSIEGMRA